MDKPAGSNGAAASAMTHDITATRLLFFKRMMASVKVDIARPMTRQPLNSSRPHDGRLCFVTVITESSIESTVDDLINEPGCQRNQDQVSTHLLPLVPIIVRQPANQPTIELFSDSRRKRLTAGQVLLYAGWQGWPWAPVISIATNDAQYTCPVDAGAIMPVTAS